MMKMKAEPLEPSDALAAAPSDPAPHGRHPASDHRNRQRAQRLAGDLAAAKTAAVASRWRSADDRPYQHPTDGQRLAADARPDGDGARRHGPAGPKRRR